MRVSRRLRLWPATALCSLGALVISGCASSDSPAGATGVQVDSRGSELEDYAKSLGIDDPPSVEVVREVSPEEQVDAVRSCMSEFGYAVSDPESGYLDWEVPQSQSDSFYLAVYTCNARYPIGEDFQGALDEAGRGSLYDHWVTETIPCLEKLGYSVDVPPTRESFVAGVAWDPRASTMEQVLADVDEGRWASENTVYVDECPADP